MESFPFSSPKLSEAARIDGCSELGIFWRIILPLSRPAITMVALFALMGIWNDFLSPLMYLQRPEQTTLAPGLQIFLIPARLDALEFPHGVQCAGHPARAGPVLRRAANLHPRHRNDWSEVMMTWGPLLRTKSAVGAARLTTRTPAELKKQKVNPRAGH